MSFLTRRKPMNGGEIAEHHRLKATLGWPHLIALGVGAIVGTGIYTLIGVGAGLAGPGVMLSFAIAGAVCACAALAYAEMATMIPAAGSAYTYSYSVLGEGLAWIVGWSLILEYTVVCGAVAAGWAGHAAEFVTIPVDPKWMASTFALTNGELTFTGGFNLLGALIAMIVAGVLLIGARESATVNMILVVVKLAALALFVILALPAFDAAHFTPFMPNGFSGVNADGTKVGVMAAASIIFFAFYGFDAVSTAAEETKNPERNLTIGIVGSMIACTAIYMIVAAAAIGAVLPGVFSKSDAPLVFVMEQIGHGGAAKLVAAAAVIALPTVIMAFMYGQSRIFFVMARDGLLPVGLAKVSKRGAPSFVTLITGVLAALLAGLLPLGEIAALANAGTLAAFVAVLVCMMILRVRQPDLKRVFRTPVWPVVGVFGVLGCLYLFTTLPNTAIVGFFVWNAVGIVVYLLYSRRKSALAQGG
jgi:APA family basic amino acid/polyamine antiporter